MNDLESLGGYLRSKREEKGLSVEDVSQELCLRRSVIEDIESGIAHEKIPYVYFSGYVRAYARLLGCEEDVIPFISHLKPKIPNREIEASYLRREKGSWGGQRIFLYALIALVIAFLFLAEKRIGQKDARLKEQRTIQAVIAPSEPSFSTKRQLVIMCHERTWISVILDGKEKKEFMLNPQDVIVLNANEGFDLIIGNAGGVKLILDGRDVNFSGKSGEVKKLKLY